MTRLGGLCTAVVGIALLGVIVGTPALAALPDLHTALGETFPIAGSDECASCTTELSTAGGAVLSGKGVKGTVEWTSLSALGKYTAAFLNVVKGAKKCKAGGDAAGTVLLSGEVHLVFVSLSSLAIAALALVSKFKVECEGLNVTIEGSVLGRYNGPLNTQLTEFSASLLGSKGKQELTKYFNEAGTAQLEASLLSEAGTGFVKSAENISEERTFKLNKMIEILG